jgi:anti-anti-sigma regulatory factor
LENRLSQIVKETGLSIELNQTGDLSLILLEGVVDIGCAEELKIALLQAMEAGREIRISTEQASGFDVCAYQLLWAAQRDAKRLGVRFEFKGELPAGIEALLASSGLAGFLTTE